MKATIENNELVLRLPLAANPQPSKSGKTLVCATTNGFMKTTVMHAGKEISVSVNATIGR